MSAIALALTIHPSRLQADPITWTIADNTFLSAGGAVSGSFQYDAAGNTYSNIDIVVGSESPQGTLIPGDTYAFANFIPDSNSGFLDLFDSSAGTGVQLFFLNSLTDAGGPDPMGIHLLSGESTVDVEAPGSIPYNASVTGAPEPRTIVIMLLGIIGIVAVRPTSAKPAR